MTVICHSSRRSDGAEDALEAQRAEQGPDHHDPEPEPEVADAVDDERLLGRACRRRLLVPEADERVAAQADRLPADVEHQEVVAQDQQQHAEHEQVQVGEEAPEPAVAVHVADGVDVDQQAHGRDHQEQHGGQGVDLERDVDLEVADGYPAVERDVQLVAAEDHVGEDDHGDHPGGGHQGHRDDPAAVDRLRRARRHVAGLPYAVVQVLGDDAVGSRGVGQVVGVSGVRRRLGLQLLGGDRLQVLGRFGMGVVVGVVEPVGMGIGVLVAVVAVQRHVVEARPDQDREQEAGQGQGRDEGDQQLHRSFLTPSGRSRRRPRGSDGCG